MFVMIPNLCVCCDVICNWHLWRNPYHFCSCAIRDKCDREVQNQFVSANLHVPHLEVSSGLDFYWLTHYCVALNVNIMKYNRQNMTNTPDQQSQTEHDKHTRPTLPDRTWQTYQTNNPRQNMTNTPDQHSQTEHDKHTQPTIPDRTW